MESIQRVLATISGNPLKFRNTLGNSAILAVEYTVSGSPATLALTLIGLMDSGEQVVLDSYTGTTTTARAVSLSEDYDSFLLVPQWTGGANVSVDVKLTSNGSGETFQGVTSTVVTVAIGSPEGTVISDVGKLYLDVAGAALWVKQSGGLSSTGWTAVGGGGVGSGAVLSRTTHITSAQLKDLVANPVELIPAPATGKMILPWGNFYVYRFGSVPYSFPSSDRLIMLLGSTPTAMYESMSGILNTSMDIAYWAGPYTEGAADADDLTVLEEQPFKVTVQGTNPGDNFADGDGTLDIVAFYAIADIP